ARYRRRVPRLSERRGERAVGRNEDRELPAAAGLILGARLRLRPQDRRAERSRRLARLRKTEVDLRRGRVRPARGDDLASRGEGEPLPAVELGGAAQRPPYHT